MDLAPRVWVMIVLAVMLMAVATVAAADIVWFKPRFRLQLWFI